MISYFLKCYKTRLNPFIQFISLSDKQRIINKDFIQLILFNFILVQVYIYLYSLFPAAFSFFPFPHSSPFHISHFPFSFLISLANTKKFFNCILPGVGRGFIYFLPVQYYPLYTLYMHPPAWAGCTAYYF